MCCVSACHTVTIGRWNGSVSWTVPQTLARGQNLAHRRYLAAPRDQRYRNWNCLEHPKNVTFYYTTQFVGSIVARLCGDICDFCVNFLRGIGGRSQWWKVLSYEFTFAFAFYIHQTILWRWWCAFEDANPLSVCSHTSHTPPSYADFATSVLLGSSFIAQPNVVDVAELFEHYTPDFKDNPIKDVSPRKTTSWVGTLQNWQFWCRIRNLVVGRVGIQWVCT